MFNTKVYVILQELPSYIKDDVIVKIGISNDVEGRLKTLQTGSAYKLHLVDTFEAGVEALKHESFIHELYNNYRKLGEWFTFNSKFFTNKVLPQMADYFSKIEVIEGKVASTNLQLEELNYNLDSIISDDYVSRKKRLIYLEKCLLVDDNKRDYYKKEIKKLNDGFQLEKELSIKLGQEKSHEKYVKSFIYRKKKYLETISMGYLVSLK
jgi:hypothetical protein|tara:strand:- start:3793 stop:4419 length:627 start_codon:yes stop_codon:yes gene_type:complete